MRRRSVYILLLAVLFPVLQRAWVKCDQHGYAHAASGIVLATIALKLALFVLVTVLLVDVSRQTMTRRTICVVAAALLFPVLQKAGIECSQHGFAAAGSCLVSAANILKAVFLILLIAFLARVIRLHPNPFIQVLVAVGLTPLFLLSCAVTLCSGWIILNASRPAGPGTFIKDQCAVNQLSDLANEMIQRQRIWWVGNAQYRFMFAINYGNVDYRFASTHIPTNHDFSKPVDAEDTSKVPQAIFSSWFCPTDRVLLDLNDYAFCKRASETTWRIGFDSVQLYREHNIVQYEIDQFFGHHGARYIYYFCPAGAPPEGIKCRQLSINWYYLEKPWY